MKKDHLLFISKCFRSKRKKAVQAHDSGKEAQTTFSLRFAFVFGERVPLCEYCF